MTGDETRIHHWGSKTKLEGMAWKHKESPTPLTFWTQPSAGKIMATIFCKAKGVLLVDFLLCKSTITWEH